MCAGVSASMAFVIACVPAPDAPSSSVAVLAAATDSAPSGRRLRSLRSRATFSNIYQEGVRCRCGGVTVVAAPAGPGGPQVGIVAGKRVGNAVRRNRAKRRLRAAMGHVVLNDGMAYIVIAGPAVPDVEFRRLGEWLAAAFDGVTVKQMKENV
jgi:ribonuclease P protein component